MVVRSGGDCTQLSAGTCPSLAIRSTGASGSLAAWPIEDLAPRQHMMAARRSEKERQHLIQPIILLYGWSLLAAMRAASLLYVVDAARPMPPVQEKTSGQNVPCSTSLMHWS